MGRVETQGSGPSDERSRQTRLLVGDSAVMAEVEGLIDAFAPYKCTVLITGPTGCGKELVAKELHRRTPWASGPFVIVHTAGLPGTLLESELFGYEKGAFTGATKRKLGRVESAAGGTLFMDEIGDISPEVQAKLLRFLQDKSFVRVGGTEVITVDTRVVAATNVDLDAAMTDGRFRADLYYRLDTFGIRLPSLHERQEDFPLLVEHLLAKHQPEYALQFSGVSDEVMLQFKTYPFAGNVRQMENFMQEAMAIAQHDKSATIEGRHLRRAVSECRSPTPIDFSQGALSPYDQACRDLAIKYVAKANGKVSVAAQMIGIDRKTLTKWLERFRIGSGRKTA